MFERHPICEISDWIDDVCVCKKTWRLNMSEKLNTASKVLADDVGALWT